MKYIVTVEQGTTDLNIEKNEGKYIDVERFAYCDGHTETVRLDNNVVLICNDSHKLFPGKYKNTIIITQFGEIIDLIGGNIIFASNHIDRNDPEPWDYYPLSKEQLDYVENLVDKKMVQTPDGKILEILAIDV